MVVEDTADLWNDFLDVYPIQHLEHLARSFLIFVLFCFEMHLFTCIYKSQKIFKAIVVFPILIFNRIIIH